MQQRQALLYARVSNDDSGRSRSVAEQVEALQQVAQREGWTVREVITDEGISASEYSTKPRPGFARLLEQVRAGDVVAVWEMSRLTRRADQWEQVRSVLLSREALLFDGMRVVDVADPDDAFTAILGIALSVRESGKTRQRIRRHTASTASVGTPHSALGFGWSVASFDPTTGAKVWELDPVEAPMIAEAVAGVLSGESNTYRITKQWNESGVKTRNGNEWTLSSVKSVLTRPSNAGLRVHRGEILQGVHGTWPQIISAADYYRLSVLLGDPSRKTRKGPSARLLLTSIAECGENNDDGTPCRRPLRRDTRDRIRHGRVVDTYDRYRCPVGHVAVKVAAVDRVVESRMLEVIAEVQIGQWLAEDDDHDDVVAHLESVAALEKRLADAADLFAEGDLSKDDYRRISKSIGEKIALERSAAAASTGNDAYRSLLSSTTENVWADADLDIRRQLVKAFFDVTVHSAKSDLPTVVVTPKPNLIRHRR